MSFIDGYGDYLTIDEVSNLLDVSIPKLMIWEKNGRLVPDSFDDIGNIFYSKRQIETFEIAQKVFNTNWDNEVNEKPKKEYNSIELFAGAGGMALGLEKAGFHHLLLNEIDKHSCNTLRKNRPNWKVIEGDVSLIDEL